MLGFLKHSAKYLRRTTTPALLLKSLVCNYVQYQHILLQPGFGTYYMASQRLQSGQCTFTRYFVFPLPYRCPIRRQAHILQPRFTEQTQNEKSSGFVYNIDICGPDNLTRIFLACFLNYPRCPISKILHTPLCRTNMGFNSPVTRLCRSYNDLKRTYIWYVHFCRLIVCSQGQTCFTF